MASPNKAFEFGPFRLEVRERRLTRDGHAVPLRGRVFDTLYALLSRHGCLVTKDELMAFIWPDSIVEESNLNHNICVLRRALGERVTGQKYVETVPRQGYRFVADVIEVDDLAPSCTPHDWEIPERTPANGEPQAEPTVLHPHRELQVPKSAMAPQTHSPTRWYPHTGVISSLAVAVLLVFGYFGMEDLSFVGAPSNSRVMVAVLPFENLTGDSTQEYVADGLSHEIIAQLGRWNAARVGVIARTSSKVYQNARKSIGQIGQELGVDYVVEGSLRRDENSYRITVLLIRVKDQAHLWAASYNREAGSVTALQEEVARTIMNEIGNRIDTESDDVSPIWFLQGIPSWPIEVSLGATHA
jgi:TolB-like protein/DNA-binding winged helix-turn-helix (wHTH) protein